MNSHGIDARMHGGGEVKSALAEMLKKSFGGSSAYEEEGAPDTPAPMQTPRKHNHSSPSKSRSLSDSTPKLGPSPKIKEGKAKARDDHALPGSTSAAGDEAGANGTTSTPRTPSQRRPEFLARGLSLQMPPRDHLGILATGSPTQPSFRAPPLSPRVEKKDIYGSPASVLPRHSRGLDFARACTNLHHSTLAEASPDSSPTITQKGMMIPKSRGMSNAMMIDPPAFGQWGAQNQPAEARSVFSSSLGSVKMLDSDSTSDSDDELEPMEPDDNEDAIVATPQLSKMRNPSVATPFALGTNNNAKDYSWASAFSPGGAGTNVQPFPNFHRARLRNGRSRKSSSSASGHSNLASPVPQSPPLMAKMNAEGYFPADGGQMTGLGMSMGMQSRMRGPASRRESLSLHTHDLHISSGNDSGDEAVVDKSKQAPMTPGVVRRAVTRRGNLLPKTRAFGRIRADLMEESTPIDAEVKREAEVIRQVRESDAPHDTPHRLSNDTTNSSPTMQAIDSLTDSLQGIPEETLDEMGPSRAGKGLFGAFARKESSGNGGKDFWDRFETSHKTPPPPSFFPRLSSSTTQSDEMSMDSPVVSTPTGSHFPWAVPSKEAAPSRSRASTPQASTNGNSSGTNGMNGGGGQINPPSAADGIRKANKRRRDDDLSSDYASMKRRAVSPGVSVGNSPILSQSPSQRSDVWGQPLQGVKSRTESASGGVSGILAGQNGEGRHGSNGSASVTQTPVMGPKRVGLQGMTDMQGMTEKMSIE